MKNQLIIPDKWPVPLKAMLRKLLPNVKADERLRDFRHWLEEDGGALADYKARPIERSEWSMIAPGFIKWRSLRISAVRSKAGRLGGKKSATTRKSLKPRTR